MEKKNEKKLLQGLSGEGIQLSVRSLAKYMASNAVLVSPHVGRKRMDITLPDAVDGIDPDKMPEQTGNFYRERVSRKKLSFIPREDEIELSSLERSLRRAVEVRCENGLMPLQAYESLKEEFEATRKQYFAKRDEIVSRWDTIYAWFEASLKDLLDCLSLPPDLKDKIMSNIMAEVASKEDYAASFRMELRVHAFPAEVATAGLDSSVAADVLSTWRDDVVSTAILAIESSVGEGWERIMNGLKQYTKRSTIGTPTIDGLLKYANELSWKNLFRNPCLTELETDLKKLVQYGNVEDNMAILEDAMLDIYEYAKDTKLHLSFDDIPFTEQQLDALLATKRYFKKAQTTM